MATGRAVPRKRVAPPSAAAIKQAQRSTALDVGDTVEFSTTFEAKNGGRSFWVKVGASSKVRATEDADEALDRIEMFCVQQAEQAIRDVGAKP